MLAVLKKYNELNILKVKLLVKFLFKMNFDISIWAILK